MKALKAEAHRRARSHALLDRHLAEKGLRRTRQREVLLDAFLDADTHISIDELYDSIRDAHPTIGPATVYRCMNLFVQAGVAKERRFNEGKVRFEPGADVDHHDHLICTVCGEIQEFEDDRIEALQEGIAAARGFTVSFHRMELYGVCPGCRKSGQDKKTRAR